mmetsp:Transcript_42763/g.56460  ORF Transcript_42763/g.56460 Transcript_42763/m.56460 type:complete len:110 (+) Transcript_42763:1563-1892(+)
MASMCLLFVGLFKILQGKLYAPYLWVELKGTNNMVSGALTGSLIMFQYALSLVMLWPMIVIRFVSCTVPLQEAYDFTWKKYSTDLVRTVLWLVFTLGGSTMLLFGTLLE